MKQNSISAKHQLSTAPITEGVLLRTAARIRDSIKDPLLAAELKALIGQEAMHTREHRRLNQRLAELGYRADDVIADIEQWVQSTEAKMTTQELVAVSVVGEHATLSVGRTLLRHPEFLDDADPEVRRLTLWHCMEEVEHQSTFDQVYQHLYGSNRFEYFRQFALASSLVGAWTGRIMWALLRHDPVPPVSQLWEFMRWAFTKPGIAAGISVELLKFLTPGYRHWSEPHSDIASLNEAHASIYFSTPAFRRGTN
jgi:uncharacterized protein